ncbi:MAG: methionyl-tRNA formyltransferase [Alphaproteobacteria bacterium]|nr:methionyl-tRNA formyltransferase [Alphaproteobacteria bacterium]
MVFMGTPDFALSPLIALHEAGHRIQAIYCQPPKEKGRGYSIQKNPTHLWGEEHGIPVLTPLTLRTDEALQTLKSFKPDVIVVVAYGMILPTAILNVPSMGCINIHASLLPRWRGAAPIQRAIMAGDSCTGLTTMMMDAGLDTGDILQITTIPIHADTTTPTLYEAMKAASGPLILSTIDGLVNHTITPQKQPEEGVTYAQKLLKTEGFLDFSQDAQTLDCHIRGLVPHISVWFENLAHTRFKILSAQPVNESFNIAPGVAHIQDDALYIQCERGALRILTLQPEGKKPLATQAFLMGYRA